MIKGFTSRSSVDFLSCSTEKNCKGTFLCCVSGIYVSAKFMDKSLGGDHQNFTVVNLLRHSAETSRNGIL